MKRVWFLIGDLVCILVFAAVGRYFHDEGLDPAGVINTAWPFLVAAVAGWAVILTRRGDGISLLDGLFIWFATMLFGMIIRAKLGGGVDPGFIAVAASFLAGTMIGGRWFATGFGARRDITRR